MILASPSRVLAQYSGLPRRKRLRRHVMVLQAYIDDSMTANEVLILAGYIATNEQWLAFSDDWQQLLDMNPRWPLLKMSDIGLSESEERWERAGWFYRAIEDHVQAFVTVSVDIRALREVVRVLDLPDLLLDPYVIAFRGILDFTAQHQKELGIDEPIDFIFDNHSQERRVRDGFENWVNLLPNEQSKMVGSKPRFEDDTEYLPLQAADLLAWHVRRHWRNHGSITDSDIEISWPKKRNIPGYRFGLDHEDLERNLTKLRDRLLDRGILPSRTITVTFTGLDGRKF